MFAQTALDCITVSVAGLLWCRCTVHADACRLNVPASVKVTCTRTAAHQQIAAARRRLEALQFVLLLSLLLLLMLLSPPPLTPEMFVVLWSPTTLQMCRSVKFCSCFLAN